MLVKNIYSQYIPPTLNVRLHPAFILSAASISFVVIVRRERDPEGWSTVLVTALGSWGKHREGDPKGWSTVLVTALGSWGKPREGDPERWSMVLVTALGSWGKPREGDPILWSTVLITALGSWGKRREGDPERMVCGANHRAGQLGET
jgi:hypothetical protein